MLPVTKVLSKEMLPVAGKPLIQYAIEETAASGIMTVVVVVRSGKSLIRSHFARDLALESFLEGRRSAAAEAILSLTELVDLQFVEQQQSLGLAHAICCAEALVGAQPFAPASRRDHDERQPGQPAVDSCSRTARWKCRCHSADRNA
jgi:UTP--glucose-1-phosphate uridylyltransferase